MDAPEVFQLVEALRGKTTLRQFARFSGSATGRRILAERGDLLDRLSDHASLAQLPPGSLGRAYFELLHGAGLSAEKLVVASKLERPSEVDELAWFRERNRDMHDLLHVIAGYGCDPLGEACIIAFTYAQTGLKGLAVIAVVAGTRIARRTRGVGALRAVYEAYRRGKKAIWLIDADWENLLAEQTAVLQERFHIAAPTHYLPPASACAAGNATGAAG